MRNLIASFLSELILQYMVCEETFSIMNIAAQHVDANLFAGNPPI